MMARRYRVQSVSREDNREACAQVLVCVSGCFHIIKI
jgi:hypothetical protein